MWSYRKHSKALGLWKCFTPTFPCSREKPFSVLILSMKSVISNKMELPHWYSSKNSDLTGSGQPSSPTASSPGCWDTLCVKCMCQSFHLSLLRIHIECSGWSTRELHHHTGTFPSWISRTDTLLWLCVYETPVTGFCSGKWVQQYSSKFSHRLQKS